jgi:hypothetical protein
MIVLKGWQQQILRKTNTYFLLRRIYRNTQLLLWQTKSVIKNICRDEALPAIRQGNIAMFHTKRSGSTVLSDLLNQHPKIFWDGEINSPYIPKSLNKQVIHGAHNLAEAIRRLQRRMFYAPQKGFYGFETTSGDLYFGHISLPDYVEHMHILGIDYGIILKRKNFLKKIVSWSVAMKRGGRTHLLSNEKVGLTQIELDTKNLTKILQRNHNYFRMLDELLQNSRVLQLTYEDDISHNPLVAYERVCNFLDIDNVDFPIRHKKTNPYELSKVISNFEEVKHTLSETPFEWMLYD